VVSVLELRRDLLVAQSVLVALTGRVRCPVYGCGVGVRGVLQGALQLLVAYVLRVAQGAVRARYVFADLGSFLGCHTAPRAEEDEGEAEY
jgi:hypothetical protein